MSNFFKEMAVDVFKGILKLMALFIVVEAVLMINYYIASKFYTEDLIEQKAKRIGYRIKSFLGIETEKERLFKKYSSCVLKHAVPYYILGSTAGYLSCRCWKGFKEGMTFGAVRGEAVGVYVGAIECDEGKKNEGLFSIYVFNFHGITHANQE